MRNAFDTARESLTALVTRGSRAQGAPLPVVTLAQSLRLSPTPVREALSYLAGEGLVEERRGQGYFTCRVDTEGLVELYELHELHVIAALRRPGTAAAAPTGRTWTSMDPAEPAGAEPDADTLTLMAERLFSGMVGEAGSKALSEVHRKISLRLAVVRRVEVGAIGDVAAEIQALAELWRADERRGLLRAVRVYHRRRIAAAGRIVMSLRRRDDELSNISPI